jgi:hypothetical protein
MSGITNEFKNVPLGNAEMFKDVPGCVSNVVWPGIEMFCRKIGDSLLKGHMGITPVEEGQQLFTDNLV